MRRITLHLSETVYSLLATIYPDRGDGVKQVIDELIDHAQQGVYRPGAWEREWLVSAFGGEFIERLETGDPYSSDDDCPFQRPKKTEREKRWTIDY